MQKLYITLVGLLLTSACYGQANPSPFDLTTGNFLFTNWPAASAAGTYPANMAFHFTTDPTASGYNSLVPGTGDFNCAYNGTSRSRFIGKDAAGISILTTSSALWDNCSSGSASSSRYTGAVVLALNTTNRESILVSWTAGTVTAGDGNNTAPVVPRVFVLQLQYRLGTSGNFTNVANGTYTSGATGSSQPLSLILPNAVNNQQVVQLRWVYYQTSAGNGGSRPEMRLDDVSVGSSVLPVTYLDFKATYTPEKLVAVTWSTVAETENAYFAVERSADAANYVALGQVAGKGTITGRQAYTFTDATPIAGWNYYRLRQVDHDGTASFSRAVAVLNENGFDPGLTLTPNPASEQVRFKLAEGQTASRVSVVGLSGQRVAVPMINPETLDITHLPMALYLLEVQTTEGRVLRQRLLKH